MMNDLARAEHVKICISSRPWNVYEEAFGNRPKMYIHDLTRGDIRTYVSDRLCEHPQWPYLMDSNPADSQWLIEEIIDRCDGVFLWVFLVTKLLREGMTNRDRFSDLRRRLESFPRELEPFFKQILDSVEPIYHEKTTSVLQVALTAKEPLHMIMYDLHDLEHDDEYYYRLRLIEPYTLTELSDLRSRMTYHLDSRTRGLLEVSSTSLEVTFLHRTVKDYLANQGLSDLPKIDLPKGSGRTFSPELSILRAYAAWVKCATPDTLRRAKFADYSNARANSKSITDGITPSIMELTRDLIPYAAQLDSKAQNDPRLGEVLDDVDGSIAALISRARSRPGSSGAGAWDEHRLYEDYGICAEAQEFREAFAWGANVFFRERLAKAGLTNYVVTEEMEEPATGASEVERGSSTGDRYWLARRTLLAHTQVLRFFRGLWTVYAVLSRYLLVFLFPSTISFSSFLINYLPSFLSRLFIIPFMNKLAKYA